MHPEQDAPGPGSRGDGIDTVLQANVPQANVPAIDAARLRGAIARSLDFFRATFRPGDEYHPENVAWPNAEEMRVKPRPARAGEGGYWIGELEADTTLESDYILFLYFLGAEPHREKIQKLSNYVRRHQLPDGSWNIFRDGPGEISASVKAYFALRLAGYSTDEPFMLKARDAVLRLGGAEKINSYTKIYLTFLNQFEWKDLPAIPPELILLPRFFFFNIYEISYWSRAMLVPLSILYAKQPSRPTTPAVGIEELFTGRQDESSLTDESGASEIREGNGVGKRTGNRVPKRGRLALDPDLLSWKGFFGLVDRILRLLEKTPIKPLRGFALRRAEQWVVDRSANSDGLGAIFPSMLNSVMALHSLGHDESHPTIASNLRKLEELEIEAGDTIRLQPCLSPVWDTALVINAMVEAGCSPSDPEIVEGTRWLLEKEVREPGDWNQRVRDLEVSGWPFQFRNEFYPDIDDTAAVILALDRCDPASVDDISVDDINETISRALGWLIGLQCSDGGWAAFDMDVDRQLFNHHPYADHNAMLDPACADITGRVLEALGRFEDLREEPVVRRSIEKGIEYLKKTQEPDGSWYGRWGVNYVYGTWQTLKGLACVGEDLEAPYIRNAVRWLGAVQNDDGGWGETCDSYKSVELKARGTSTASQTAWAVMGLLAAGEIDSPELQRGMEFLLSRQNEDGTWDEPEYTGTGFPDVFYLRYHLYRVTFPLFALGYYQNVRDGNDLRGVGEKAIAPPRSRGRSRSPAVP